MQTRPQWLLGPVCCRCQVPRCRRCLNTLLLLLLLLPLLLAQSDPRQDPVRLKQVLQDTCHSFNAAIER